MIIAEHLQHTISFEEYMDITKEIIDNPAPHPPYDNVKMKNYTAANYNRMMNIITNITLEKKLYNLLNSITDKWTWVILTEPWCGDASQIVPALCAFANVNSNISCKLLRSDAYPQVLDNYLTNGSRSIPKLICLKADTLQEIGTWGPRPALLQTIVEAHIADTTTSFGQKVRQIHQWYDDNKTVAIQEEFIELLQAWKQ